MVFATRRQGSTRKRLRQRLLPGFMAALFLLFVTLTIPLQAANAAMLAATITVSNPATLRDIPVGALGANEPQYLGTSFTNSGTVGLVQQAGIKIMRYPGGSNADYYHWYSNSVDQGVMNAYTSNPLDSRFWPFTPFADKDLTFDAYMATLQQMGAQADITINYGSGTVQEAKDWVGYANKNLSGTQVLSDFNVTGNPAGLSPSGHTYGVKYWEIGNEVYGDGTYGASTAWEYDTVHGPAPYGQAVVNYANAMRSVDPSIQVGVVLTMPTNAPDGAVPDWNTTVLSTAGMCDAIQFVAVHWYAQQPNTETDPLLLNAPANGVVTPNGARNTAGIPAMMSTLKGLLSTRCPGRNIGIRVTEANSVNSFPGKQTVSIVNSMFLEDTVATFLENGAQSVDWWSLHNGFYQPVNTVVGGAGYNGGKTYIPVGNTSLALNPNTTDIRYGDFGLLSNGPGGTPPKANSGQLPNGAYYPGPNVANTPVVESPLNSAFPSYYGMEIASKLYSATSAGAVFMSASSSNAKVIVHATKISSMFGPPTLAVMVINEDPGNSYNLTIKLPTATAAFGASNFYANQPPGGPHGEFNQSSQTISGGTTSYQVTIGSYSTYVINFWLNS